MTSFSELLTWYWNVRFEPMIYTVFIVLLVIAAIIYYAKSKRLIGRNSYVTSYAIDL